MDTDLGRNLRVIRSQSSVTKQGRLLISVIGIDRYAHWPSLTNAVNDALGVQQIMVDKFGFVMPVAPLLNQDATKVAIEELIDSLREILQSEDSLLLYFAGHGHTREDMIGENKIETGFIVPVDARAPLGEKEFWREYIELEPMLRSLSTCKARHILVILDSCFSGFALGNAMDRYRSVERYSQDLSNRLSRKVLTSARRDQRALDGGASSHSLFTDTLIKGLDWRKADLDNNGLITSSELALYVQQQVAQSAELRFSQQTPDFGSFQFDGGGELLFTLQGDPFDRLKAEALSAFQAGDLTGFKRAVQGVIGMKPQSRVARYLYYRLCLLEDRVVDALAALESLRDQQLADVEEIPLWQQEIVEFAKKLRYWRNILAVAEAPIEEATFPLQVTLLTGADEEHLHAAERIERGEVTAHKVEHGAVICFDLVNLTQEVRHVYLIAIDTDGHLIINQLWRYGDPALLGGVQVGEKKRTILLYGFGGSGLDELRLYTSPTPVGTLLFPPSPDVAPTPSSIDDATSMEVMKLYVI